jgi:hypothetical protein
MRPELDATLAASDEMRRILAADLRDELLDIKIARNTVPAIAALAMLDSCLAKRKGNRHANSGIPRRANALGARHINACQLLPLAHH